MLSLPTKQRTASYILLLIMVSLSFKWGGVCAARHDRRHLRSRYCDAHGAIAAALANLPCGALLFAEAVVTRKSRINVHAEVGKVCGNRGVFGVSPTRVDTGRADDDPTSRD